jgi:hypothetical protein
LNGKITNERRSQFLAGDYFEAKDEYGHEGLGSTAEEAQKALEEATTAEGFGLFKNTSKNNLLERRVERP